MTLPHNPQEAKKLAHQIATIATDLRKAVMTTKYRERAEMIRSIACEIKHMADVELGIEKNASPITYIRRSGPRNRRKRSA